MSKSSTTSTNKSLPVKSAWARGPPQPTSAPSPRSQSPAPSAQQQPQPTHSRRPSTLGQAVPIKDGVTIPRNIGAAAAGKQGSPVTFGSIDDASAQISSSPAPAPPTIKETIVKSFGTVPAASNGKASVTRPSVSTASPGASSSAPSPAATAPAKLDKRDIAKLFQSSPAPSAPSPADTQSPSIRNTNLPAQNQQPQTPSSSQFTPHFTPFVPSRPQPQNSGPSNGPNRSPVYPRQMPNGTGPRPPAPPNGASSTSMPSPRLGPPHAAQQGPPATPQGPPGQPHMPPQMVWNGGYYYPDPYVPYPSWGYVAPGMPPQGHPPHMGPPPHMPPHPMSPHTPSRNLQPSTPTMSHAAPNPTHPPHPPPPLSHPSTSMGGMTSPPPTPSTARLNPGSNAFVPGARSSKILIKNADGKEVPLEALTKASSTSAAPPSASGQSSPFRQSSPAGTPKRQSIRIESEDQRRKRLEEEQAKQRAAKEAEEKIKKEKEDAERKKKEEEEKKEQERIKAEEEEKEKERLRLEEEARKVKEEEERKKREQEELERLKREEEERQRREAEAVERARKEAEEKERLRKEDEEKKAREDAERKAREEEEKKQREAAEAKQRAEAEAKVKSQPTPGPAAAAPGPREEGEIVEAPSKDEIKEKVKESLRINTSTSNQADLGRRRPANLDLSGTKGTPIASALATARSLDTLEGIKYPEGISSPKAELNEHAKPGRFRYDRDFLLQFKEICRDRPPNLPPLDAIGLEPIDQAALMMSRGGSGRRGASGPVPSRQSSMGSPFGQPSGLGKPGNNFSGMGNFAAAPRTSEDRFAMSNSGQRVPSGVQGSGFRPNQVQRVPSHQGRVRSKRGDKRPPADGGKGPGSSFAQNQGPPLEPVAPLQVSENRWDRKTLAATIQGDSPEVVERKVNGLLNKLTMEKFDSISDQIIGWANKSEAEKDGRTLIQVIRLVFVKATDEANWSEMYARLCRKMMEQISPKVQDEGIKNQEGKPITGGQLFRKYLLNRCQEDFERGWAAKDATAAAAAAKAKDDDAVKTSNGEKKEEEIELYSEEYYAAAKAKRQGLGLIKFIGELFKLQMLTERIMHECVKKLLGNVENPEEEEIESLCKLLTTVGQLLDTPKAQGHMDIYFSRMEELTKSNKVSSRMHFMLQDVIELRARKWVSRTAVAAPTTIAQVHENALKEKAALERENMQRQISMSRTNSNRGRGRNDSMEPDGWAVAGNRPPPAKAGDLSNFGKISKGQPISFGPSSVFSKSNKAEKRESISRTASSSNMFSMLQNDAASEPKPEPQRKKLALLPRSVPKEEETSAAPESDGSDDEEAAKAAPDMSEADAKKKIDEDIKELFAVRNIDEAENYFTALPAKYHAKLVDKLTTKAVEQKTADAELVASVLERASTKRLSSASAFEEGLSGIAEFLEDIAIDAPHAYQLFALMVKGAKLDADAHSRIAAKDTGSKLLPLLS